MPKKSFDILIRYQLAMRLLRPGKSHRQIEYISLANYKISGWAPGNPKRPYPTDVDMRAGILPQFHPNQQQTNNTDVPRPEAPLGTDGKFFHTNIMVLERNKFIL